VYGFLSIMFLWWDSRSR